MVRYRLRTVTVSAAGEPAGRASHPAEAIQILRAILANLDADREHVIVLALNNQNRVIGYKVTATGGQVGAPVDMRTLFRDVLLLGAAGMIVGHNHPSGDPEPSRDDRLLTERIKRAAELLDIRMHDHIILGRDTHVSLAERGLL